MGGSNNWNANEACCFCGNPQGLMRTMRTTTGSTCCIHCFQNKDNRLEFNKMASADGCGRGGDRGKRHVVNDDNLDTNSGRLKGRRIHEFAQAKAHMNKPNFRDLSSVGFATNEFRNGTAHERSPAPTGSASPAYLDSDSWCTKSSMNSSELERIESELQKLPPGYFASAPSSNSHTIGSTQSYGNGSGVMGPGFRPLQHGYHMDGEEETDKEDLDRDRGHRGPRRDRQAGTGLSRGRETKEDEDDGVGVVRGKGRGGSPRGGGVGLARGQGRGDGGDDCWRLMETHPGGPINPEPLVGFLGHVAHDVWYGEERGVLTCHNRADCLSSWSVLSGVAINIISASGLEHLKDCMFPHLNMPLISAFVERWHPETNSFHMPFGEMTITLHDVWYILRIPVKGRPVISEENEFITRARLAALLGMSMIDMNAELKSNSIMFKTLQQRLSSAYVDPMNTAIGYLLWLLGGSLFLDKSSTRVSIHYFPFVQSLKYCNHDAHPYAWGAATLSCLYRQLGIASRAETHEIEGCMTLLEAWIYEYFPAFRPIRKADWKSDMPCSMKWVTTSTMMASHATLVDYRHKLDTIAVDSVNWAPFGKTPATDVPNSLFTGIIHCLDITEPYMPDRCLRQFGYVQTIPRYDVYFPKKVHRGRNPHKYQCEHEAMVQTWRSWEHSLIRPESIGSFKASFPKQVVGGYMVWFRERSHCRVSAPDDYSDDDCSDDDDDSDEEQMSTRDRLQNILPQIRLLHPKRRHKLDQARVWEMLDEVCRHFDDLLKRKEDLTPLVGSGPSPATKKNKVSEAKAKQRRLFHSNGDGLHRPQNVDHIHPGNIQRRAYINASYKLRYILPRIRLLHPDRRRNLPLDQIWKNLDSVCRCLDDML